MGIECEGDYIVIKKLFGYGILLALFTGFFAVFVAVFGFTLASFVWTISIVLAALIILAVHLIVG